MIRGTSGYIKGNHFCVSFTEVPVTEIASLFAMANSHAQGTLRFEPFGIAVAKEWPFNVGGRTVIDQPDSEYHALPPLGLQRRQVMCEPPLVDFIWEREYRV